MRTTSFLPVAVCLTLAAWATPARAQVADAQRAAARELFKQGDELQRAGHFADALDRFRRAEEVIHAPTNLLRVAECEAALNRLVEAAESYRGVVRWALPAGSPPAFQSAVDQARGELAQVEPRVPRVVVQVAPAGVAGVQLVVDGTPMPGALIGEGIPLDPGDHKISATAPGYASPDAVVTLRERETHTVNLALKPVPGGALLPPAADGPPAPAPPVYESGGPPGEGEVPHAEHKESRSSVLLGAHLGIDIMTGTIPLNLKTTTNQTASSGDVSGPGLAGGLDGGLRFLRQWYLGLSLERAGFATGKNPGTLSPTGTSDLGSNTTSFGLVGAIIVNPDRPSLYAELGLQARWYSFSTTATGTQNYTSGELLAGIGLWLPVGRWLRLLPLATGGFGSFSPPGTSTGGAGEDGHAFVMLGLAGFYNIEL